MKDSDQILHSAGETVEYARLYLKQQGEILRLEAAERTAKVTSAIVTAMVLGVLGLLVMVMLSLSFGFWLAQVFDSVALAFLLVAVGYVLLGTLVYIFRRKIITNPALDFILRKFFEEDDLNENEEAVASIQNHYLSNSN